MDVAHWGSYSLYLRAIQKTDELTGRLWDEVQSNRSYRDKTTMIVVPELGRDGDMNAANGFLNHRSGDPSCRNVWALAIGGGLAKGETDRPVSHVDLCATAAELLEVRMTGMEGKPLTEALA
jgi:arylsulfatase A-like enzyme